MVRPRSVDRNFLEMALIGYQTEKARIESEKARIDAAIADIQARLGNQHRTHPAASPLEPARKKRHLSPAARKRISLAQKERWAAAKQKEAVPEKPKRRLSAAGRKAIVEATKRRWEAIRAAKAQEAGTKPKPARKAAGKAKAPRAKTAGAAT